MKRLIFLSMLLMSLAGMSAQSLPEPQVVEKAGFVIQQKEGQALPFEKGVPVVVDFNAVWCGPCKYFKPIFHSAADRFNGKAKFVSVDVDDCPTLSYEYRIQSVPTIIIFDSKGKILDKVVGAMDEDAFISTLSKYL